MHNPFHKCFWFCCFETGSQVAQPDLDSVATDDLKLLTFLPPPPGVAPCPVSAVLQLQPRVYSCVPGKRSANQATSLAYHRPFSSFS